MERPPAASIAVPQLVILSKKGGEERAETSSELITTTILSPTFSIITVLALTYGVLAILTVPVACVAGLATSVTKEPLAEEYELAAESDDEVVDVICPRTRKPGKVTVVGLDKRRNPETRLWPLRVTGCTVRYYHDPDMACNERCLNPLICGSGCAREEEGPVED